MVAYVHISKAEVADTVDRMVTEGILIPMRKRDIYIKIPINLCEERLYRRCSIIIISTRLRAGMPLEEFRSRFSKQIPDKEISALIPLLTADQSCRLDGKYIAASSFKIQLTEAQKEATKTIAENG